MFEVLSNEVLAPDLHRLVVKAPRVARARKAGQFVIVRADIGDERIPLTIGDADSEAGTISLFIQAIGASTRKLVGIAPGGHIRDVAGPLGMATHLEKWGRAVCIGGGVGTAVLYPLVKALEKTGNEITTIIGGRSASYVILQNELKVLSKNLFVTTDDGSLGEKGLVTQVLARLLSDPEQRPHVVFAVGPGPMMKAVAEMTRAEKIPTMVSLNPIMIDGTGMCGGCRVDVGGEVKFACVDGPEFDGHLVDFDLLRDRLGTYREQEQAQNHVQEQAKCKIGRGLA